MSLRKPTAPVEHPNSSTLQLLILLKLPDPNTYLLRKDGNSTTDDTGHVNHTDKT
ncbi:hypothetical protein [Staphylococcus haemolyticus]|uniref:hypothetical protein n=1 Tax=Staphylococcus haemolyticus TaxID=1283 RepID=UPI0034DCEFB8